MIDTDKLEAINYAYGHDAIYTNASGEPVSPSNQDIKLDKIIQVMMDLPTAKRL